MIYLIHHHWWNFLLRRYNFVLRRSNSFDFLHNFEKDKFIWLNKKIQNIFDLFNNFLIKEVIIDFNLFYFAIWSRMLESIRGMGGGRGFCSIKSIIFPCSSILNIILTTPIHGSRLGTTFSYIFKNGFIHDVQCWKSWYINGI